MINEQLFLLYESCLNGLGVLYSKLDLLNIKDYAGPHLIYCWEDFYTASKYKLLIVGQETNGWYDEYIRTPKDIRECIRTYENFKLGESKSNTPFWRYSRMFNAKINGEYSKLGFIWTNINKFGATGIGHPNLEVTNIERKEYNIFTKELQILKPDICLFLTGPNYDNDIKAKVVDVEFEEFTNFHKRQLVKVKSAHLPLKSYRTYHPGYGNRKKELYMEIFQTIIDDIENENKAISLEN